jgi:hypothetical protein
MRLISFLTLAIILAFFTNVLMFAKERPTASPVATAEVSQMPLAFEPNVGQSGGEVRFLARTPYYTVLLQSDRTVFLLPPSQGDEKGPKTVTMALVDADQSNRGVGVKRLRGVSNYYLGNDSANWFTGIRQYGEVAFRSVRPGTDLVFHGANGKLEYDLVLASGTDPRSLAFRISGVDKLELTDAGDLSLSIADNLLTFEKPAVFQWIAGKRKAIPGKFVLRGNNEVTFALGPYDNNRSLVIDPVLSYATLIGANNNTVASGIAVDSSGYAYVTGTTSATDYPTVNAAQSSNRGYGDVFVTKLASNGRSIIYSTYLGGSMPDYASAIAVSGNGEAYVTGTTGSTDFPTTPGAFMTTCPGICNTPFVAKFSANGSLAFSTYMGGGDSTSRAIAVNSAGEAYITGLTASNDIPTTPGVLEPIYQGALCTNCYNGYVERLNSTGAGLVYSTYFGLAPGNAPLTIGNGIAVDSTGSAYIVGTTTSIPTQNPLELGPATGFVAKLTPDGSGLSYGTYLGGSGLDTPVAVAVDLAGNAHIVGNSTSCDFPLSLNAFSTICITGDYQQKVFVGAIDATGTHILFSTFLGDGSASAVATDNASNTYVAATTRSYTFPAHNPIEATYQGSIEHSTANTVISQLDLSGKLLFSTYLGGQADSGVAGLAVDTKGSIYVTGTASGDFPLLHPIPAQVKRQTNYQIFIAKILPKKNAPEISLSPLQAPVVSVRNVSSVPLTITAITTSANLVEGGDCIATLAPGTGCNLLLQSTADNKTSGSVTITSNAHSAPLTFVISKNPQGDGVGAILKIVPASLQFPSQLLGTTSTTQPVILRNIGLEALPSNTIAVFSNAFAQTNDCPAVLPPASFCTISVSYTPTMVQQDFGQLAISHDPTQDTIYLSGSGVSSAIVSSTKNVLFGSQFVGGTPLARIVNLANTTPYTASAPGVSVSSGFTQTNACNVPLLPQASCRVAVTYQPASNENATGTLTATGLGPGGAQTVNLLGTGLIQSDLMVSPLPLQLFADVNQKPGTGAITVTNTSSKALTLSAFTVSGPFTQTNNCHATLFKGQSCTINANFAPTDAGTFSGAVSIQHSGKGSPQVATIVGMAQTVLTLDSPLVDYGQQPLNTPVVGFEGYGDGTPLGPVHVSSVTVEGADFKLTKNDCPMVVQPFTGCGAIQITFTPSQKGLRTGTFTVIADDTSHPHIAILQGTGISSGIGTLSPSSLDFGSQAVGTESQAQVVTLTNTGSGTLTLGSIVSSPQFSDSTTCGSSLGAGANCQISIKFSPTLKGMLLGSVTVQDDGAGSPHTVTLSGIGK